jgi:hypothetical protein
MVNVGRFHPPSSGKNSAFRVFFATFSAVIHNRESAPQALDSACENLAENPT